MKVEHIPRVVIDTNVFMSSWALDIVLTATEENLLTPIVSADIISELEEHIQQTWNLSPKKCAKYVSFLRTFFHDKDFWVNDYHQLVNQIVLPDPNDRHVLAAAIKVHANYILTWNVKDFPKETVNRYGITVATPDGFLTKLLHDQRREMLTVVKSVVVSKQCPPRTFREELNGLNKIGLTHFVRAISHNVWRFRFLR